MKPYSRTLPLVGGRRVVWPARETGSSALDVRTTWGPPVAAEMVLDASGLPAVHAVVGVVGAPWPAPDPSMRVDRPAPTITTAIGMSNLVEPLHPVDMPDLTAARRAAAGDHTARVVVPVGRPLPPPTLADAAEHVLAGRTAAAGGRHGTSRRLVVSLAAAAGVACAAVAAAVALL